MREVLDTNPEFEVADWEDVERAFAEIIELGIMKERSSLPYRQRIAECEHRIYELVGEIPAQIKGRLDAILRYAEAQPKAFRGCKTLKLHHGTITQRKRTPSVSVVDGHDEEDVITSCQRKEGFRYLLTDKPVLDRDLILRLWKADELTNAQLKALHLEIRQGLTHKATPNEPKDVDTIVNEAKKQEAKDNGQDHNSES